MGKRRRTAKPATGGVLLDPPKPAFTPMVSERDPQTGLLRWRPLSEAELAERERRQDEMLVSLEKQARGEQPASWDLLNATAAKDLLRRPDR